MPQRGQQLRLDHVGVEHEVVALCPEGDEAEPERSGGSEQTEAAVTPTRSDSGRDGEMGAFFALVAGDRALRDAQALELSLKKRSRRPSPTAG